MNFGKDKNPPDVASEASGGPTAITPAELIGVGTTSQASPTSDEAPPAALEDSVSDSPLILMMDIESLDLGPRSVVLQAALYALDQDEDSILEDHIWSFFPVQPQLDLIQPRTISATTVWWWMQQDWEARRQFEKNVLEDFEALPILMRHFTREFNRIVDGRDYLLYARGPQFDVVNMASLYKDVGMAAPWETPQTYGKVRDLRTIMGEAGLSSGDVPKPHGFVAHQAAWDCRYQLAQFQEARKHLRART